jgi:hypothetical protein
MRGLDMKTDGINYFAVLTRKVEGKISLCRFTRRQWYKLILKWILKK